MVTELRQNLKGSGKYVHGDHPLLSFCDFLILRGSISNEFVINLRLPNCHTDHMRAIFRNKQKKKMECYIHIMNNERVL
jgi:hypothetical protein